jgi:threonine/homoserine efflux transporter RhtA
MPYPDLVWSALAIIGGLLLIKDASQLSGTQKAGVMVIFGGFIFRVCWALLHQTEPEAVTWNLASQIGVGWVALLVVILLLLVYPGPLRRRRK